jgi:hypothetical protein
MQVKHVVALEKHVEQGEVHGSQLFILANVVLGQLIEHY